MAGLKITTVERMLRDKGAEWATELGYSGIDSCTSGDNLSLSVRFNEKGSKYNGISFEAKWFPSCCGIMIVSNLSGITKNSNYFTRYPTIMALKIVETLGIYAGFGGITLVGSRMSGEVGKLLKTKGWKSVLEFNNPYHGLASGMSTLEMWVIDITEKTIEFKKSDPGFGNIF